METSATSPGEQTSPELSALRDNLIKYEIIAARDRISSAEKRQARDVIIVTWRDILHSYLKQIGLGDPVLVHKVINNMDDFLNREKEEARK
jgi:hypothetical protein